MAENQIVKIGYIHNGFLYNIVATPSTHRLLDDSTYFQKYIEENQHVVEVMSMPTDDIQFKDLPHTDEVVCLPEENKGSRSFIWNSNNTKLLLTEYGKRNDKFRDPKCKKKHIWNEIKVEFNKRGYDVTEDMLDRKLRNLKHHYKTIKDNNKKTTTGRGRMHWEFFELMEGLFVDDKTINFGNVFSSMATTVEIASTSKEIMSESNNIPEIEVPILKRKNDNGETPLAKKQKAKEGRGLYKIRQENMKLEERRVRALEELNESFQKHNQLQAERNELLKTLIEQQLRKAT